MPEWIFFICIIETIIGVYIIRKAFKKRKELEKTAAELLENVRMRNQEIQKEQRRNAELSLSLENADNANDFVNKLGLKQTYCHQRYLKIYQKKLIYHGIMQEIYAVFYEDDYIYEMDYLKEKSERFDINTDVSRFKLNCRMFIDGKDLDPSLNGYIVKENSSIKIEELNMHAHEGKGGGSFYLECLSKELLRYPQIQYLYGELSPVDFRKKDKLLHFYRKNGFETIIPMTEKKSGYVAKTIRWIDEDILKLTNKGMTFGVEIEFQLRNGHNPIEIAQEMYKLELSDCEEVRTYDTIADIHGWKIIKEKTCDYEIISPVLTDTKKCWEQMNLICCILIKYGAYTDYNCAFQVHIGTKNLLTMGKQWTLLMDVYRQFEPITCVLSRGEFDNISKRRLEYFAITMAMADKLWCKGMSIEQCREEIEKGDLSLISHFYRTRKIGMNWNCMSEEGKTIEFRTFNGTIDFFQIQSYLMYICNLVDKVALMNKSNVIIEEILHQKKITEEYIDSVINYLTDDNYICGRLKANIKRSADLDEFTWDMLNGQGKVYVD